MIVDIASPVITTHLSAHIQVLFRGYMLFQYWSPPPNKNLNFILNKTNDKCLNLFQQALRRPSNIFWLQNRERERESETDKISKGGLCLTIWPSLWRQKCTMRIKILSLQICPHKCDPQNVKCLDTRYNITGDK